MTLTRVSGVWLEQASMTDTPKFVPNVCLAARISANPNKEPTENIDIFVHLTEADLNYEGASHKQHSPLVVTKTPLLMRAPSNPQPPPLFTC